MLDKPLLTILWSIWKNKQKWKKWKWKSRSRELDQIIFNVTVLVKSMAFKIMLLNAYERLWMQMKDYEDGYFCRWNIMQLKIYSNETDGFGLIRLGAVVGAERVDGVTPLLLAAQEGHVGRHHHSCHHHLGCCLHWAPVGFKNYAFWETASLLQKVFQHVYNFLLHIKC